MSLLLGFMALTAFAQTSVSEFKSAFEKKAGSYATTKPDAAILACMDILAKEAKAKLPPDSSDKLCAQFIAPFERAVDSRDSPVTDFSSLGIQCTSSGSQQAISVRMGACSRVYLWRGGKPIAVPASLGWLFGYNALPHFSRSGALVIDGFGIQDYGIRYAYRILVLSTKGDSCAVLGSTAGRWVLEDAAESHIAIEGDLLTVRNIDEPKAFFTRPGVKVFPKTTLFKFDQSGFKAVSQTLGMLASRAADAWMASAQKSLKPNALQAKFLRAQGKDLFVPETIAEKTMDAETCKVILDDLVFTLKKANGRWDVKALSVK